MSSLCTSPNRGHFAIRWGASGETPGSPSPSPSKGASLCCAWEPGCHCQAPLFLCHCSGVFAALQPRTTWNTSPAVPTTAAEFLMHLVYHPKMFAHSCHSSLLLPRVPLGHQNQVPFGGFLSWDDFMIILYSPIISFMPRNESCSFKLGLGEGGSQGNSSAEFVFKLSYSPVLGLAEERELHSQILASFFLLAKARHFPGTSYQNPPVTSVSSVFTFAPVQKPAHPWEHDSADQRSTVGHRVPGLDLRGSQLKK